MYTDDFDRFVAAIDLYHQIDQIIASKQKQRADHFPPATTGRKPKVLSWLSSLICEGF